MTVTVTKAKCVHPGCSRNAGRNPRKLCPGHNELWQHRAYSARKRGLPVPLATPTLSPVNGVAEPCGRCHTTGGFQSPHQVRPGRYSAVSKGVAMLVCRTCSIAIGKAEQQAQTVYSKVYDPSEDPVIIKLARQYEIDRKPPRTRSASYTIAEFEAVMARHRYLTIDKIKYRWLPHIKDIYRKEPPKPKAKVAYVPVGMYEPVRVYHTTMEYEAPMDGDQFRFWMPSGCDL